MSDFSKLKEFIDLAKNEGVEELKYETEGQKFFVSFASAQPIISHTPAPVAVARPEATESLAPQKSAGNFHEITSPFVGTYYSSPAP